MVLTVSIQSAGAKYVLKVSCVPSGRNRQVFGAIKFRVTVEPSSCLKVALPRYSIGTVLTANPDLEGLVAGLTYGRPEVVTQAVDGGPAIKTGVIIVTAEYEAATPLT